MSLRKLAQSITVYSLSDIPMNKNKVDILFKKANVYASPVNISNAIYHGKLVKDVKLYD